MFHRLKSILLNMVAGANVATVVLMLVVAYCDRLHPVDYPLLACSGMLIPFFLLANLLFIPFWVVFSWRRLAIPVVGFLLAIPTIRIYMPLNGKGTPPEGAIRVVSYNVCCFEGNFKYEHAFDTIFNYLKDLQADIVCLQEDKHTALSDYSRYFPYNDTAQVAYQPKSGHNFVGIHTRFPILKKEKIPYPSLTNGSIAYYLQVNDDTIIVINNHLESVHLNAKDRDRYTEMLKGGMGRDTMKAESFHIVSKLSEAMRMRAVQADSIHNYIERHRQYPILVCGDFNDTPVSYVRRRVGEGLTDCYVETGRGLGLSYNRRGFNFRIDNLMCSSHFTPYACEIDSKMDASDHYPILCWLKIDGK